jgi:cystathionine gamma-synthase
MKGILLLRHSFRMRRRCEDCGKRLFSETTFRSYGSSDSVQVSQPHSDNPDAVVKQDSISNVTASQPITQMHQLLSMESLLASAGCERSDPLTGAVSPPIYLSSTFERDENLELVRGYNYGRLGNPNRHHLEAKISQLEGGVESFAFSSGMQGAFSLFMTCPGCHVILSDDLYHGVFVLLKEVLEKWGITYEKHDLANVKTFRERIESLNRGGISRRVLVWAEVPTNPTCKIPDIPKLNKILKTLLPPDKSLIVIDSTWATPFLIQPLKVGADVVLHSTTKYISGHSDCTGGTLTVGSSTSVQELLPLLRTVHQVGGGVLSPFDSWLTLRGLRTLGVRMKTHCENAMIVAEYLKGHKAVEHVYYPGLPSHPQHQLANSLFGGRFGGMLSFLVKGEKDHLEVNALKVLKRVLLFKRATSLGGTESLIEHRATVEGIYGTTARNLLRVSVGLEDPGDLIADLEQALNFK